VIPGETDAPGELPRVGTGAGVSQYLSNVYLVSWDVPDLPSTAARGARLQEHLKGGWSVALVLVLVELEVGCASNH
jgi:hypothetical protein